MSRFDIDFFEFSFLVEATIPPRPIARAMFWQDVIDKHYHVLTKEERAKLFEWIQLNPSFDVKNEDCLLFYDRFNPDNQVVVTTEYNGKVEEHECFMHNGRYHTTRTTSILEDYITGVKKNG